LDLKARWERTGRQVRRDLWVLKANKGRQAHKVRKASQAHQDRPDRKANKACEVPKEKSVPLGRRASPDVSDRKGL
jgi:hypothetical protein